MKISALGALAGSVSNMVKTIRDIRSNAGSSVHSGKGPYKSVGSYTITRKSRAEGRAEKKNN